MSILRCFRVAVAFLCAAGPALADDIPEVMRPAVENAVERVKPGLVRIHVVSTMFRDGREMKFEAFGSGVVISEEGHVVTNHHVAGDATRIFCTLANREEIEADLVGTDALTDIAVIKLKPKDGLKLPVVPFGDSSKVKVGDYVLAMGSPLALSQSVTLGIVSNTEMIMPRRMFGRLEQDGEDVGSLVRWIAHDAQIYGGNSGGPLVNLAGEIIGINEISVGLGGAIPGNLAREVATALIRDGAVKRAWLGIGVRPLLKSSPWNKGVLVTDALKGSPADKAGFRSGDVLIQLAGRDVTVRFEEEVPEFNLLAANLPIGKPVEAVVIRDDKEVTLTVTPIEREKVQPHEREFRQWGLSGRDISFVMAKEMRRDSSDGVAVTGIRPGGPAGEAKPSLNAGDVIIEINGRPVKNCDELARITHELTENAEAPVPVLTTFERKTGTYMTVVKVGIEELYDPGLEVKKAWLPVETQVLTRDIAQIMDQNIKGFRVTRVYKGSTADQAGLKVGDIIVSVDGEALTATVPEHYEELPTIIRNYRVGTVVELGVLREGQQLDVPVELVRAPMLEREMRKYRDDLFEFTARDVTFFDRANEDWDESQQGVIVEEVKSGGWAALGMLGVGDLVAAVNNQPVADVAALRDIMEKISEERPSSVVMKTLRGIYTIYVELEPKWETL